MRVTVEVYASEATRVVERLSRRMADGRPQLLSLVSDLAYMQLGRYTTGRGVRWRRPKKSTLLKDEQEGRDRRPLIVTGELMRSLTMKGHPLQIVRVRPERLEFGTRVYYARFHHRGEGVPRRTVVGASREDRKYLVAELRGLLLEDA